MKSVTGLIRLLALAAAAVPALFSSSPLKAQDWPQRPVKLILPLGAGSGADTSARFIGEKLQKHLGRAVVIEPRPGGDSVIAINAVLNADDNHTFFFGPASIFVMHPHRYAKLSYDFQRDFVPLAQVAATTVGFTVPASLPVKSLKEFIDYARTNPGKVSMTVAPGTSSMMLEAFVKEQNIEIALVPYRDVVQAANDLANDRLHAVFSSLTMFQAGLQANRVRVIAISGERPNPRAPGAATAIAQGYPRLGQEGIMGLFAPSTTSAEARKKMSSDFLKAIGEPDVAERITSIGLTFTPGGAEAFEETIRRQTSEIAEIAKVIGLKPTH
jgi:tripartite-type tricarboxylate transporter receptor subunit TctC